MNKQIDEMARDLCECYNCDGTCYQDDKPCDFKCDEYTNAQYLYEKGYRKQSEGEWEEQIEEYGYTYCFDSFKCSNCEKEFCPNDIEREDFLEMMKYCPNCGAHMTKGR